jgi:transposase
MKAAEIVLTPDERVILQHWTRAAKTERRQHFRAQVILELAQGLSNEEVARRCHARTATVSKWRGRFARWRVAGLVDAPRSGKPPRYDEGTRSRILQALDERPPLGYARWNGPLLARRLKNVSSHQIWRVLRQCGISLERRRSWCISTDPCFAQKAADVVGLYVNPPENAMVLCVDEKPHIQALERAQGWLKLPNGKALTGFAHEYKRHGTTTLFAALEVATGLVKVGHYRRRRRVEFLDFMNSLLTQYPGQELHVILDNLNTHKPKHDRWLSQHKNVHLHFIPTHASWLNQVEVWFSILASQALAGASFTHPSQVRERIDAFIAAYNQDAHPFVWTKQVVFSKHPRSTYANL